MSQATFRFADELSGFLRPGHRGRAFVQDCAHAATLKNAIEALGVPHTEVGAVTVNGEPATLQRAVRDGDAVEVAAYRYDGSQPLIFLADAHLGGLARFLRMLGFDTLHDPAWPDAEIRRIAHDEIRIVLTRDRGLLMCRDIARGCYVRAIRVEAQLGEVVSRYRLSDQARPFTLCLCCNVPLEDLPKEEAAGRVPDRVLELHDAFTHCSACGRIYWPGTHYERMKQALDSVRRT
jgi:uncharacterized protein with PIN domain/sulfur carrier protein ThiS